MTHFFAASGRLVIRFQCCCPSITLHPFVILLCRSESRWHHQGNNKASIDSNGDTERPFNTTELLPTCVLLFALQNVFYDSCLPVPSWLVKEDWEDLSARSGCSGFLSLTHPETWLPPLLDSGWDAGCSWSRVCACVSLWSSLLDSAFMSSSINKKTVGKTEYRCKTGVLVVQGAKVSAIITNNMLLVKTAAVWTKKWQHLWHIQHMSNKLFKK